MGSNFLPLYSDNDLDPHAESYSDEMLIDSEQASIFSDGDLTPPRVNIPTYSAPKALAQVGFNKPVPMTPMAAPRAIPSVMEHQGSAAATETGLPNDWETIPQQVHKGTMQGSEAIIRAGKFIGKSPIPLPLGIQSPGEEVIARSMLAPIAGFDILDSMPESQRAEGVNELNAQLGETGTTATMGVGYIAGNIPSMIFGLGWADQGKKVAQMIPAGGKVLAKVLELGGAAIGSGAEGAITNAAQATMAGESVGDAALVGGAFGAGMVGVGALGEALAKKFPSMGMSMDQLGTHLRDKAKVAGSVFGNVVDRLGDEIAEFSKLGYRTPALYAPTDLLKPKYANGPKASQLSPEQFAPLKETAQSIMSVESAAQGGQVEKVATRVRPGSLEPSVVVAALNPEGKLVGLVTELNVDGTKKFYEMPLETPEDASRLNKLMRSKKIPLAKSQESKAALLNLSEGMIERLFHDGNRPLAVPDRDMQGTPVEGFRTHRIKKGGLDTPISTNTPDNLIVTNSAGHVKLEPIYKPPTDLSLRPEPGEIVFVQAGGVKTPGYKFVGYDAQSGQAVLIHGERRGPDGKILKDAGGKPKEGKMVLASPEQVVRAPPEMTAQPSVPSSEPTLPRLGEISPPVPKRGEFGFMRNPEGGYLTVKVLGFGDKPGTLLVQSKQGGAAIQIEASKIESRLPPGVANFDDLLPIPLPTSAPFDPNNLDPAGRTNAEQVTRVWNNMGKDKSAWEKMLDATVGGHARGAKPMMEMVQQLHGAQEMARVRIDIQKKIQSLLPKGADINFRNDLTKVSQGSMSWDQLKGKYGDMVTAELEAFSGKLNERRTQLDKRMSEEFGVTPETLALERATGALDQYLARDYLLHILPPGEWAKHVPAPAFNRAVEVIVAEMAKDGKFVLPEEVALELGDLLHSGSVTESVKGSGLGEAKSFKRLLARQEIDPAIRAVMGEITAYDIKIASTIGTQEAIIAKLELFRDIANNQMYSSVGRRADMHPEALPDVKQLYGDLAGRYVKPEIYDEIINLPNSVRNAFAFANTFTNWVKGNRMLRVGPLVRSMMDNMFFSSVMSGGLSWTRPDAAGKDLYAAIRAISDYHNDPTGAVGDGWLVREAKKLGADWTGAGEVELSTQSRQYVKELLASVNAKKGAMTLASYPEHVLKLTQEKWRQAQGLSSVLLDSQDRIYRMANYIALRRKLIAGTVTKAPMTEVEASKEAAYRIAQFFQNTKNVGPVVAAAGNTPGVGAMFLRSMAEDARRIGYLPKRMMEDPELIWRVASNAIAVGGILGVMRQLSGISSEEIKLAEESRTKGNKTFGPAVMYLPLRDGKGNPQYIDVGQYFLPTSLMTGHPDDAMLNKVGFNLATFPIQGTWAQDAASGMAEQAGLLRPTMDRRLLEGEGSASLGLEAAAQAGLAPGFIVDAKNIARKTGLTPGLGKSEEPMTPLQGVANAAGIKVKSASPKGFKAATMERIGELRGLSSAQLKQLFTSTRDPAEKERIKQAIVERIKQLAGQQGNAAATLREFTNSQ